MPAKVSCVNLLTVANAHSPGKSSHTLSDYKHSYLQCECNRKCAAEIGRWTAENKQRMELTLQAFGGKGELLYFVRLPIQVYRLPIE